MASGMVFCIDEISQKFWLKFDKILTRFFDAIKKSHKTAWNVSQSKSHTHGWLIARSFRLKIDSKNASMAGRENDS